MDVDEFFNMFMDKLENLIKGTPQEKVIDEHFGGKFANELIFKECPHQSERLEPFNSIAVQVKNKNTLEKGLEAFVKGEIMDGDNCVHCEKCDKKVPTLKRTCIKKLPKNLIIALKRFEFDYETMQKFKLNDLMEFPTNLNMEPYTKEGLERAEREAKLAEKGETDENVGKLKYPKEYYQYKLRGVVVHSGVADGGHYYSFIEDRENDKWFEFNDNIVSDFSSDDIPDECFGGEEKWGYNYRSNYVKTRNAYLVIYERQTEFEPEDSDEEAPKEQETSEDVSMAVEKVPADISDALSFENQKYW